MVVSFFPQFFQDIFYTWDTHLGTCMVELIKPSCQAKNRRTETVFHLTNRLNVPLHLKDNCTFKYSLSWKRHPFKLLNSYKGGWAFWPAVLWLCFKLPICLFGHTRDTSIIYEKAKLYATVKSEIRNVQKTRNRSRSVQKLLLPTW